MTAWTADELDDIGSVVEMRIAALRPDGTPRSSVIVWVVRVDDDLYVRSYRGADAAWFRGTRARAEGIIEIDDTIRDVAFVDETDPATNDRIDAAYRVKYRSHGAQYVDAMVTPEVRATTIKLVPR
ncbi:DUF2255 family protein [Luedemannella helvata]|uniref:DUF2255 family protein n=1 Tax=Luedemannella helvata TaxID=349315 RepID=A0ABN2KYC8_9ACTN